MPRPKPKPEYRKTKRRAKPGTVTFLKLYIDKELYNRVKDIAAIESNVSGRETSLQDLIRMAVNFVYEDGERLRECFRRARFRASWRLSQRVR